MWANKIWNGPSEINCFGAIPNGWSMSSNGKSSDGGGGEDADDEDGVNKNIKSGISNIPKSFEQRYKVVLGAKPS